MAAKDNLNPDQQLQLPGVDWDKETRNYRKSVVEHLYTQGLDAFGERIASQIGRTVTPITYNDTLMASKRHVPPAQEIVNLLALSEVPTSQLEAGRTVIAGESRKSSASNLGSAYGYRNVQTGSIRYDKGHKAPVKRAILTHELAHSLQSNLGKSTLEIELDKRKRERHPGVLSGSNKRYDRPGADPEIQSVSWLAAQTPVSEGSAEGFRERYQGAKAENPVGIVYSPQHFHDLHHVEGTTFGKDAAEAYEAAHSFTKTRGEVVKDIVTHDASRLAGVLKSDLDTEGKRQQGHDIATTHRMSTYLLHLAQGGHPGDHPHAAEYFERRKAIEGEVVQTSMFPQDIPEVNQFGLRPTGTPERSARGEALAAGVNTERSWENTMDAQYRAQVDIVRSRKANKPLERIVTSPSRRQYNFVTGNYEIDRRVSKHYDKLQNAVRATQQRREEQNRVQSNEVHPEVEKWLGKLVYDKKRDYARAYALSRQSGGALPELPTGLKEEHAQSARDKIDKIFATHRIGM